MFLNLPRQLGLARWSHGLTLLLALAPLSACQSAPPSPYRWTEFVSTRGHANPIPKQWVATPEGRFAHDLVIPNPVPADSGYKPGMSDREYYLHLCKTEAGDFVFKTVDNVEGLYFPRIPKKPSDQDLMDKWKLEHPRIESKFQLMGERPVDRAALFIDPPVNIYRFYEEPNVDPDTYRHYEKPRGDVNNPAPYLRLSGHRDAKDYKEDGQWKRLPGLPWEYEPVRQLKSRYGLTWRGIHRPFDRENGIAGGELIVYEIQTNEVLAVFRNYAFTGHTKNTPDGAWWLTSGGCRELARNLDHLDGGLGSRPPLVLKPAIQGNLLPLQ